MSSGHVLSGMVPTEEEYERVEYDEVKELLQLIFKLVEPPPRERGLEKLKKKLTFKRMMKKVYYSIRSTFSPHDPVLLYRYGNTTSLKEWIR